MERTFQIFFASTFAWSVHSFSFPSFVLLIVAVIMGWGDRSTAPSVVGGRSISSVSTITCDDAYVYADIPKCLSPGRPLRRGRRASLDSLLNPQVKLDASPRKPVPSPSINTRESMFKIEECADPAAVDHPLPPPFVDSPRARQQRRGSLDHALHPERTHSRRNSIDTKPHRPSCNRSVRSGGRSVLSGGKPGEQPRKASPSGKELKASGHETAQTSSPVNTDKRMREPRRGSLDHALQSLDTATHDTVSKPAASPRRHRQARRESMDHALNPEMSSPRMTRRGSLDTSPRMPSKRMVEHRREILWVPL